MIDVYRQPLKICIRIFAFDDLAYNRLFEHEYDRITVPLRVRVRIHKAQLVKSDVVYHPLVCGKAAGFTVLIDGFAHRFNEKSVAFVKFFLRKCLCHSTYIEHRKERCRKKYRGENDD